MNLKFIFVFCLFRVIEVMLSSVDRLECVKRKSGTCKAFNVTDDFDHFINLRLHKFSNTVHFSTIIEFDYSANKHSYEREENKNGKEFDISDSPVIEILFTNHTKYSRWNYRLVLGEKLNRLAYLQVIEDSVATKFFNNYSPDLPSWPFTINVTINDKELMFHTIDGDGFDKSEPFLRAQSILNINYMLVRSRNKNVKIVGFYDCSTKYGANCGTENEKIITGCREKFSPLGSGSYNTFVNLHKFNRNTQERRVFEFDEIFGVYRRNSDSCVILFSPFYFEVEVYIRITIGDEISVRMRKIDIVRLKSVTFKKDAVINGLNQEPSQPNFIRIKMNSEVISIYNVHSDADYSKPILTMKLCNFIFGYHVFMSVTSYRFKTVSVYYDCKKDGILMETDSTTARPDLQFGNKKYFGDIREVEFKENGWSDTQIFLNTTDFREPSRVQYIYEHGSSMNDYCDRDLKDVQFKEFGELPHTDGEEKMAEQQKRSHLVSSDTCKGSSNQ